MNNSKIVKQHTSEGYNYINLIETDDAGIEKETLICTVMDYGAITYINQNYISAALKARMNLS